MTTLLSLGLLASVLPAPQSEPRTNPPAPRARPMEVIANRGQWPTAAHLQATGGQLALWAVDGALWLQVEEHGAEPRGVAVELSFSGAAGQWSFGEADRTGTLRHYLLGNDATAYRTDVPSFRQARWQGLYPGTDLVLGQRDGMLCYDLCLRPGASLGRVRVAVSGHQELSISADGALVIRTALGELRQTPPQTWAESTAGARTALRSRFVLLGEDCYGFAVEGWDGSSDLVVDPGLIWGSHFGGGADDSLDFVARDSQGRVVTTGNTRSVGLPSTAGAYRPNAIGNQDGFVAVFSADGTSLLSCTYYGGTADDKVESLQVLSQDRIAIGGTTSSTNLGMSPNSYQPNSGGGRDAFVAIFNASCTTLEFASYYGFGGDQHDVRVWVQEVNNTVFVAGRTLSPVAATANAFQNNMRGPADLFLAVINRAGPSPTLSYGTMYGGDGDELAVHSIHVTPTDIATIGITTTSTNAPLTAGPYQSSNPGGARSCMIVCLQPGPVGPATLVYSSYYGSDQEDNDLRVELDAAGFFTVICNTNSPIWPTTQGAPFTLNPGGASTGVVARINPGAAGLAAVQWMTFLGGTGEDLLKSFSRDDTTGQIAVCGGTRSSNAPVTALAMQSAPHGGQSGYLAVLDPALTGAAAVVYASYFDACGTGDDQLNSIRLGNELTVAGSVAAPPAPVIGTSYQPLHGGGREGIVAMVDWQAGIDSFVTYGTPCGAPGFQPQISPDLPPRMCAPFRVQLTSLRPSTASFMVMGLSNTNWLGIPLPRDLSFMGMTGCTQYVSADVNFLVLTGTGSATFGFNTPASPWFYGLKFYLQLGVFDPAGNPFGVVWSNAGDGTVVW